MGLDHTFLFGEIKRGTEGAKAGTDDHREMIKMATIVVERIKNQPLLTSKEETGFIEKKNGELPIANTAPVIPIPNDKIADKVKAILRNFMLLRLVRIPPINYFFKMVCTFINCNV